MESTGRILILLGIFLTLIGGIVILLARTGIPYGNLPGDLHFEGKNGSLFLPLGTSLIISVILTVLANLLLLIFNR